jgi:hypothetical protein
VLLRFTQSAVSKRDAAVVAVPLGLSAAGYHTRTYSVAVDVGEGWGSAEEGGEYWCQFRTEAENLGRMAGAAFRKDGCAIRGTRDGQLSDRLCDHAHNRHV